MTGARLGLALSVAVLAFPSAGFAQTATPVSAIGDDDALKVGATLRVRYETIDGQVRPGFNASDDLLSTRTTLAATYDATPIRFAVELFDSRAYLADEKSPVSTNEVNTFELVQAYVAGDIDNALGAGTTLILQGGRFLLNLGSRRLVAADDYRNTTSGFTGARADIKARSLSATLVYVLPQLRLPDALPRVLDNAVAPDKESFDQVLWGGVLSRAKAVGTATAEVSFFHLGERDAPGRPSRNRSLNTITARLVRDPQPGALDYEVEGMYQFGHVRDGLAPTAPLLEASATFVHAELGYGLPGSWKPHVSLEFDRASGDGPGGAYGRFDTFFGMRRADLAPAGIYNAVGRANIVTPGIRLEAAPGKRVDGMLTYRLMWLADRADAFSTTGVRDPTGRSGSFAGQQVDARLRYWIAPGKLRFEIDGVWLAKGAFLRNAPNAPKTGDTRYLSVNLSAML